MKADNMVKILAVGMTAFIILAFFLSARTNELSKAVNRVDIRSTELLERAIRLERYQQCLADGHSWILVQGHHQGDGKYVETYEYCERRKKGNDQYDADDFPR